MWKLLKKISKFWRTAFCRPKQKKKDAANNVVVGPDGVCENTASHTGYIQITDECEVLPNGQISAMIVYIRDKDSYSRFADDISRRHSEDLTGAFASLRQAVQSADAAQ